MQLMHIIVSRCVAMCRDVSRIRRFYFQDSILPVLLSAMPLLLNLLKTRFSAGDHCGHSVLPVKPIRTP